MSKNRNLRIKKPLSIKVYAELTHERYGGKSHVQRSSPVGPRIVTKNKAGRKSRFVDDDQVSWWPSYFQADGFGDVVRGRFCKVAHRRLSEF